MGSWGLGSSVRGVWGVPDAEFNWCEEDYRLSQWVAEPVNTASCLVMILLPLLFLAMHEASKRGFEDLTMA